MKNFKELKVWVKAHQLTLAVYQATSTFPATEFSCASIEKLRTDS